MRMLPPQPACWRENLIAPRLAHPLDRDVHATEASRRGEVIGGVLHALNRREIPRHPEAKKTTAEHNAKGRTFRIRKLVRRSPSLAQLLLKTARDDD